MQTQALSSGVGNGQPNVASDVLYIQQLLNLSAPATTYSVKADGVFGSQTLAAIKACQMVVMQSPTPDGVVSSGSPTLASLESAIDTPPAAAPVFFQPQPVPAAVLTADDYQAAAEQLKCEAAAIQAVAQVESSGSPFDPQGRPAILFERHVFRKQTNRVWDGSHPDLSNATRGGYGLSSMQYARILEAATLAEDGTTLDAALSSASWGMFQVMGYHAQMVGFASVQDLVTQMRASVSGHLNAFAGYILATPNALKAIQSTDWTAFAKAYNGDGSNVADYAAKINAAYTVIVNGG